jgi:VanZ family protein
MARVRTEALLGSRKLRETSLIIADPTLHVSAKTKEGPPWSGIGADKRVKRQVFGTDRQEQQNVLHGRGIRRGALLLFVITLMFIVYGSLYPFALRARPLPHGILDVFLASLAQRPGRGDTIANVLLYVPFGLFLALVLPARFGAGARSVGTTGAGFVLSAAIEITQLYDVGRHTSLYDLITNTTGAALGALVAVCGRHVLAIPAGSTLADPAAAVFAVSWVGYRLAPFVPTLNFQALKDTVKPLFLSPTLTGRDVLRHFVSWLLFATLTEAALEWRHRWLSLWLTFVGIETARLFLVGARITPAELVGGALACLLWALPRRGAPAWLMVTVLLTVTATIIEGLAPYTFRPTPAPFHLIPFYGFLGGAVELNVRSLLQKLFLYGGLVWALTRLGWHRVAAAGTIAALLLVLELMQRHLPGRLAEITDPLIALCAMVILMALPPRGGGRNV